uniref:F-box domain-containing protein n=1 Tax=Chenopodium quinoa TaxID=63459 RepID=A0A803MP53_CHEQI
MQTEKMKTRHGGEWPEGMKLPQDMWTDIFLKLPMKTLLRLRGVCKSWAQIIDSPAFITEHCQSFNENSYKNRLLLIERIAISERFSFSSQPFSSNSLVISEWPEDMKLPQDMWTDIFLKLPVKTLLRLRGVYKSWAQIIDSPAFITEHCQSFNENSYKNRLLLIERIAISESFGQVIKVVKSTFEEIALITMVHRNCIIRDVLNALFLFQENGVTQKLFILGFDPSCKDYKIIGFRAKDKISIKELSPNIKVYSCNNNCWKIKTVQVNDAKSYGTVLLHQHYFCQGAAHWMMSDGARKKDGEFKYTHVLSFDFRREEFRCVELPDRRMIKFLFVFGKSLAVFGISAESTNIWIMREDNGKLVPKNRWILYDNKNSSLDAYNFFQQKCSAIVARVTYDEHSGKIFVLTSRYPVTELMSYDITSQQIQTCGRTVGAALWMMRNGDENDGEFTYTHVLSLDFKREEFRCVELPNRTMLKFLFTFGKSLAVIGISAESSSIWIMREDVGQRVPQSRWELYNSLNSSLDTYNFFQQIYLAIVSRFTYDEHSGKLFALTSSFFETKLISYDITSQQKETCGRIVGNPTRIFYADTYVENLVNPEKDPKDNCCTASIPRNIKSCDLRDLCKSFIVLVILMMYELLVSIVMISYGYITDIYNLLFAHLCLIAVVELVVDGGG